MRGAFLLATLVLAVPADAQPTLLGQDRETVEERVERPQDEMKVEKVIDNPSTVCYDIPLLNVRSCFRFVDGVCRSETDTYRKKSRKDILKDYTETKREWEQPVAFKADFTEVKSFERAQQLADPLVVVAFPPDENGVGMVWNWNTTPKEEGLTGGKYVYSKSYVDLTYVEDLDTMNHWGDQR